MSVLEAMQALRPTLLVWAEGDQPKSNTGVLTHQGAQVVPGLDGQVVRLTDADMTVTGVPDVSGDRSFSVAAWFRGIPHQATRTVVSRVNGSTHFVLEVGRDGLPAGLLASTAGNYRIRVPGDRRVDDGQWHLLAMVGWVRRTGGVLNFDTGGINLDMWVDQDWSRSGYIDPGLFGLPPRLGMTSPVVIGRHLGGSPLQGDVGPVAVYNTKLGEGSLSSLWSAYQGHRTSFTGWGIAMS